MRDERRIWAIFQTITTRISGPNFSESNKRRSNQFKTLNYEIMKLSWIFVSFSSYLSIAYIVKSTDICEIVTLDILAFYSIYHLMSTRRFIASRPSNSNSCKYPDIPTFMSRINIQLVVYLWKGVSSIHKWVDLFCW